ncbi:MAG: hypothetical protein WB443_06870, partial [Nitrososphaeraceae archaeon]
GLERIFFKTVQPEITADSFSIMFVYIAVDFGRSRSLYTTARKYSAYHKRLTAGPRTKASNHLLPYYTLRVPKCHAEYR